MTQEEAQVIVDECDEEFIKTYSYIVVVVSKYNKITAYRKTRTEADAEFDKTVEAAKKVALHNPNPTQAVVLIKVEDGTVATIKSQWSNAGEK